MVPLFLLFALLYPGYSYFQMMESIQRENGCNKNLITLMDLTKYLFITQYDILNKFFVNFQLFEPLDNVII